jgi:hypothetical protein
LRRLTAAGVTAAGLLIAVVAGPLSTSAAAPFVYGCAPATEVGSTLSRVTLYNGSATTANVTMKLLAFDGTNRSALMSPLGSSFTIAATNSRWVTWNTAAATDPAVDDSKPSSVRVVSDQSIAVGLNLRSGSLHSVYSCV